jgi:hypothetical protein
MHSLSWRSAQAALTVVLLLLGAGVALAASPVGTWTLDEAALRDAIRQKVEAKLAKLSPEKRAQAEAMMGHMPDTAKGRLSGTAEFKPDGTVVFVDGKGRRRTGRWTQEGDTIHAHGEGGQDYVGTLEGDTMRVKAGDDDGGSEPPVEILLHRQ